jgi:hypothetical protein
MGACRRFSSAKRMLHKRRPYNSRLMDMFESR